MDITQELVERIARLSRLTLSDEEKTRMGEELKNILGGLTSLETLHLEGDLPKETGDIVLCSDETEPSYISAGGCDSELRGEER